MERLDGLVKVALKISKTIFQTNQLNSDRDVCWIKFVMHSYSLKKTYKDIQTETTSSLLFKFEVYYTTNVRNRWPRKIETVVKTFVRTPHRDVNIKCRYYVANGFFYAI